MSSASVDVVIVGSGPAGMSTALHLVDADPRWAQRIVVLDKATHPREKPCAGGVTGPGVDVLRKLGLEPEVPSVPIREMQLRRGSRTCSFHGDPFFRVFRRAELDHWMVRCGQQRGVEIRQGEAVRSVRVDQDGVEVVSDRRTLQARVVVAADGATSTVRRLLGWERPPPRSRLLEVLTREREDDAAFRDGIAVIDFTALATGLQGYAWDFPSLVRGRAFMNRGVFNSRGQPEQPSQSLKAFLFDALRARKRDPAGLDLTGFPLQTFDRAGRFSRPRVLLAGDAAGADPLLGEGISFAVAYGQVVRDAIVDAFARGDFSFGAYRARVLRHHILSTLVHRTRLARLLYGIGATWQHGLAWRIVSLMAWGQRRRDAVRTIRRVP